MPHHTSDTRILGYEPLLAPAALLQSSLGQAREATVEQGRADVRAVLEGADDRLLVVVGPCSVATRSPPWTTRGGWPSCAARWAKSC